MDFEDAFYIKTFKLQGLSNLKFVQALPCLNLISTPLIGDSSHDLNIVDIGPVVMLRRCNHASTIEDAFVKPHTLAIQLPIPDKSVIQRFQELPGGDSHSPFQMPGARSQWFIPQDLPMLHLHIDRRFLSQVVGEQAKRDYLELCNAQSRKAYDANVLMQASLALERAMEVAENLHVQKKKMNYQIASGLVGDIFLPLIKSDLCEMKVSTRQKILSRSLDYIREHFNLPIRLSNIAEASSTSMRNLQIVFKQELDISPNRYLQQFRLHRFREQLMKSSSVSEAAYACGFKHLGRLTELYAKAFERNPSADLMVKSSLDTEVGDFFED